MPIVINNPLKISDFLNLIPPNNNPAKRTDKILADFTKA